MKGLMKYVSGSVIRAKCVAISNDTREFRSLIQRIKKNKPSNASGCFVAPQKKARLDLLKRFAQSSRVILDQSMPIPALLLKRQRVLYMVEVIFSYDNQSLHGSLDVWVTLDGAGANSKGHGLSSTACY